MWPFTNKPDEPPDSRPPSAAAKSIAASLEGEPERWKVGSMANHVVHDSGVTVSTYGYCIRPDLYRMPDSDIFLLRDAIGKWCATKVALPSTDPTPGATR